MVYHELAPQESVPFWAPLFGRFVLVVALFPSSNMFIPKKTLPEAIQLVTFARVFARGKKVPGEA